MLSVTNIQRYFKAGKGRVFTFYITDEEMSDVLLTALAEGGIPYTLLSYSYDGDKTFYFKEVPLEEFIALRKDGYDRFYLRNCKIMPHLDIPSTPVIGGKLRTDYVKFFLYNGLIDIQHGFMFEHKYFSESSIGLIDKYYHPDNPSAVFENRESSDVFNKMKKNITWRLKFRSKETWLDGSIFIANKNNVSEGFSEAVKEKRIQTKIEIV